ncbi:hypothetical protein [Micromonospora sp. WMMD712]|uniref:hypothetical protein n=1 Tax=Micromonospora sp. WMMD712 TaxID=3016096 RepID=UPI00249BEC1A|nr:hypothetical protein [Micromonospora sp. WMMD712]WFE56933.1 hypothetical protein O7633_08625 [Micromonospora sp. WMMD712]
MNVMNAARLEELCLALRRLRTACDDKLVSAIEADVAAYERDPKPQLPPDDVAELLPLMGWLMYEATWAAVRLIRDGYRERGGVTHVEARAHHERILRIAHAAQKLPWPEYAPRALGALRALALAESKEDTRESFDRARFAHQEARRRHTDHLTYHRKPTSPQLDSIELHLDEILLQLDLAETGTACRIAERMIDRWAEEFAAGSEDADRPHREKHVQLIFSDLSEGATLGEQALDAAERVKKHNFVDEPTKERLALPTSFVNPGIMTARAVLLMLGLSPEMQRLGYFPLGDDDSWDDSRSKLRARFDAAYEYVERPITNSKGEPQELRDDLKLAVVQIRLAAALLMPGRRLRSSLTFAPCLSHEVLDDAAVEAMSAWLTETIVDGKGQERQRSMFRGFGGALMPNFFDGVEACRVAFGGAPGYRAWRARWFVLDKYADEPGRAERVSAVVGRPVTRSRPI